MGTSKCCLFGPLIMVPVFFSVASFILAWIFTFDCRFVDITHVGFENETTTVGLFTIQDFVVYQPPDDDLLSTLYDTDDDPPPEFVTGNCVGYAVHSTLDKEETIDGKLKFARIVSLLLCVTTWAFPIMLMCASCMNFGKASLRVMAGILFFLGFLSILCFVVMASAICKNAPTCSLGLDGILCICASLLWFISGMFTLLLKAENKPQDGGNEESTNRSPAPATAHVVVLGSPAAASKNGVAYAKVEESLASRPNGSVNAKVEESLASRPNGSVTATTDHKLDVDNSWTLVSKRRRRQRPVSETSDAQHDNVPTVDQ